MLVKENEENIIKTMSKEEFLENVKSGKKVFYNIYFDSIDLSKLELHGIKFEKCVFRFVDFTFSKFPKCEFTLCEFIDTDFSNLKVGQKNEGADFNNCNHIRTNFSNAENFYLNEISFRKDNNKLTSLTGDQWTILSIFVIQIMIIIYLFFKN